MSQTLTEAVTAALKTCAGPIDQWAKHDTRRLLDYCIGFAWSRAGFPDEGGPSEMDIAAEVMRQVVATLTSD